MIQITKWGATPEQWDFFDLGLGLTKDLLPVVCNPGAPISAQSKMKKVGKTPSIYNRDGEVVGLGKWTEKTANSRKVSQWSQENDYGICIQTRHVRALDIDVPDKETAERIRFYVQQYLTEEAGVTAPVRYRENSGKCLLAFYVEGDFPKRVVKVEGGIVEFLATGQQFVAAGIHESGQPYKWNWQGYGDFPTLTKAQADTVWARLCAAFGLGESVEGNIRKDRTDDEVKDDRITERLVELGLVLSFGQEGQAFIECPFSADHTTESVESGCAYFPANSRGYVQGHFHCLHAHCADRTDAEFMDAFGITDGDADDFENLPALPGQALLDLPPYQRNKNGEILPTVNNLNMALARPDICGRRLAFDTFSSEHLIADEDGDRWRPLEESDYFSLQLQLEDEGFKPINFETLKRAIKHAAQLNSFDSAQVWLDTLPEWDKVSRVERFLPDFLGTEDTPYTRAVGRYIWSALAGRILRPGVKADMAPIFFGGQGIGKSTAIELISPVAEFFTKMSFAEKDDDLSRKLRGKLVIEIDELRGLATRDAEYIKSFIAKTAEHWVKKYEERTSTFLRRCIFFASTNHKAILADETGERRWLPASVGVTGNIALDRIKEERDQLWAEGRELFLASGVDWSAEKLALPEHDKFAVSSPWAPIVKQWLDEPDMDEVTPASKEYLLTSEVLAGALGIEARYIKRNDEMEIGKILRKLGYVRERVMICGERFYAWVKPQA